MRKIYFNALIKLNPCLTKISINKISNDLSSLLIIDYVIYVTELIKAEKIQQFRFIIGSNKCLSISIIFKLPRYLRENF